MENSKATLAQRIKRYEASSDVLLTPRMPVIIRVDGRSFSKFTKRLNRPFDQGFINAMVLSATMVMSDMQGCKVAYVQSDEASFLLTDYDKINSQGWFGYELQKMVSISAACMTAHFMSFFCDSENVAMFDSRAFNLPKEDVVNYFLWRTKDWQRNSLQMYCRSFFSHQEMHKKSREDMHEMLHSKGKNWTNDLPNQVKNGTFIIKDDEGGFKMATDVLPSYESVSEKISIFI